MYRHTSIAATLFGDKTGRKGSKPVPNILIVIGTLREKLVQLFKLFFFLHVPFEPERVFENVH